MADEYIKHQGEQVFEITVPLDGVDWTKADPLPEIVERFHRRHEELYTYCLPDQETVLVNARVAVAGMLGSLPQEPALPPAPPTAPVAIPPGSLQTNQNQAFQAPPSQNQAQAGGAPTGGQGGGGGGAAGVDSRAGGGRGGL